MKVLSENLPLPSFIILNARSLLPKLDELAAIARTYLPSIIVVTESWLNSEISDEIIRLPDYACPFRRDRSGRKGGGVCVYISSGIRKWPVTPSENASLLSEHLWIDIPDCKILLFAGYIPPNLPKDTTDAIRNQITTDADTLKQRYPNHRLILTGDFNKLDTCDLENELNLVQIITEATRGNAILDKVFMDASLADVYLPPSIGPALANSDHRIISLRPPKTISKITQMKTVYDLRENNINKVRNALAAIPWQLFYLSEATVDEKCDLFHEILTEATNLIPKEEIVTHQNGKPWITPLIITLINKRYAAFRTHNFELYKHYRLKIKCEISKAKLAWVQKINRNQSNPWVIINKFRNKNNANKLRDIINSFQNPIDAANAINSSLANHFVQSSSRCSLSDSQNDQWNVVITTELVYNLLRTLKVTKSAGSDSLSPRLIALLADVLAAPLTHLFCLSVDSRTVPRRWKLANVCPVPKKVHPTLQDLRPISMLPIFSKILEKLILSSVKVQLIEMYGPRQFGFRPLSSTLHANICLHNFITEKLELGRTIAVMLVSTDLRRAFDSLSHQKLLQSLEKGQLPYPFLQWCTSFLTNRTQRVVLDESTWSETVEVTSGVPQGSVISPYLFAAHMGSLTSTIPNCETFKYADDVFTVFPIENPSSIDDLIHEHLSDMQSWCQNNGLSLNSDKTKIMMITKKGRTILPSEESHLRFICHEMKVLGVIYNDKLSWSAHITSACSKARRNLHILKQIKKFANKRCLLAAYSSLIMSTLEYCGPLFLGLDSSNEKKLDKVRKRSHLIICGPGCHCSTFEKLVERRKRQSLQLLSSMKRGDHIMHHLYPRMLPTSKLLALPHCSTKRRLSSFIPQIILLQNSLHTNQIT